MSESQAASIGSSQKVRRQALVFLRKRFLSSMIKNSHNGLAEWKHSGRCTKRLIYLEAWIEMEADWVFWGESKDKRKLNIFVCILILYWEQCGRPSTLYPLHIGCTVFVDDQLGLGFPALTYMYLRVTISLLKWRTLL